MAMFTKQVDPEQKMKKVESEAISSIVDQSMAITGEISFKGKTRIDGTVTGNIEGEHLILSETGKVVGDIKVESFNCYGSLEGNIFADMLTARKNCSIAGKIEAGSLTVEPGAALQGEIKAAANDLKLVENKKASPQPDSESASS